jgi:hypothetical protein
MSDGAERSLRGDRKEVIPLLRRHGLLDDLAESPKPIIDEDLLLGKQIGVLVAKKRRRNWRLLLYRCGNREVQDQENAECRYGHDAIQTDVL